MLKADLDDSVSELGTVCDVSRYHMQTTTTGNKLTSFATRNTIPSWIIQLPCTVRSSWRDLLIHLQIPRSRKSQKRHYERETNGSFEQREYMYIYLSMTVMDSSYSLYSELEHQLRSLLLNQQQHGNKYSNARHSYHHQQQQHHKRSLSHGGGPVTSSMSRPNNM